MKRVGHTCIMSVACEQEQSPPPGFKKLNMNLNKGVVSMQANSRYCVSLCVM